jgi:predicted nucleic acid-binding protein
VIVVDTSVWIDYYRQVETRETTKLERLLGHQRILLGDLILCELLQGVRDEREAGQLLGTLGRLPFEEMVGREVAVRAAAYYRDLRARGITIRKTVDLLIGAFCVVRGYALLHNDRDFVPLVRHFGLAEA